MRVFRAREATQPGVHGSRVAQGISLKTHRFWRVSQLSQVFSLKLTGGLERDLHALRYDRVITSISELAQNTWLAWLRPINPAKAMTYVSHAGAGYLAHLAQGLARHSYPISRPSGAPPHA